MTQLTQQEHLQLVMPAEDMVANAEPLVMRSIMYLPVKYATLLLDA